MKMMSRMYFRVLLICISFAFAMQIFAVPLPGGAQSKLKPGEVRVFKITDDVGIHLCWIPPGKAALGSNADEHLIVKKLRRDLGALSTILDEESHLKRGTFETNGYWLGKYEVTQEEWKSLMGKNPSTYNGKLRGKKFDTSRFPVDSVSWEAAQKFIDGLNLKLSEVKTNPFNAAGVFSLPSEDEWEYACRGGLGNNRQFYFGNLLDGSQANCCCDSPFGPLPEKKLTLKSLDRPTDVGSYVKIAPHPWNLCDMHGNVSEWTRTIYANTQDLVRRGGSFMECAEGCRSAVRDYQARDETGSDQGFRVCYRPK